jgi:hypothetical protein
MDVLVLYDLFAHLLSAWGAYESEAPPFVEVDSLVRRRHPRISNSDIGKFGAGIETGEAAGRGVQSIYDVDDLHGGWSVALLLAEIYRIERAVVHL